MGNARRDRRARRALLRGAEALAALLLVLFCFFGFTVIISLSFPDGTSLKELMFSPGLISDGSGAFRLDTDLGPDEQPPGRLVAVVEGSHAHGVTGHHCPSA